MLRVHPLNSDSLARNRARHQKRARFDSVGNHLMFRSVQRAYAFNNDAPGSRAFDFRAHFIQKIRKIDNFWFLSCAFDHSQSVREHSGHHDIIGAEDRRPQSALHVNDRSG